MKIAPNANGSANLNDNDSHSRRAAGSPFFSAVQICAGPYDCCEAAEGEAAAPRFFPGCAAHMTSVKVGGATLFNSRAES